MGKQQWPQAWQRRLKHRKATARTWDNGDAQLWSAQHQSESQYNPHLLRTDDDVRDLELRCVNEGVEIASPSTVKRMFYMERPDLGDHVGACSGELTYYVLAEWHRSGAVRGRPISATALRQKGIRV